MGRWAEGKWNVGGWRGDSTPKLFARLICRGTALLTVRSESHSGINGRKESSGPHPLAASAEKVTPTPKTYPPSLFPLTLKTTFCISHTSLSQPSFFPSFSLSIPSTPSLVNYCNGLAALGGVAAGQGVGEWHRRRCCVVQLRHASRLQQTQPTL